MQGAIMRGLFSLPDPVAHTCPGSCSWHNREYVSLGFSSQCQNVTQITTATAQCVKISSGQNCTFTTPGNIKLQAFIIATDAQTVVHVAAATDLWRSSSGAVSPKDFVRFGILRIPNGTFNENGTITTIWGQEFMECSISLTAFKYSNITVNGTSISPADGVEVPLTQLSQPPQDKYYIFNETGLPSFTVSSLDWFAISQFFISNQFSGSIVIGDELMIPDMSGIATLPLFKSPDIRGTFANMSRAMTLQLRTSAPGSQVGFGETNKVVSIVRVSWVYMILPLGVLAASAVLLVATVAANRRSRGVPLWKYSPIPLLYHTIREQDGVITSSYQSPVGLDRQARTLRARLE